MNNLNKTGETNASNKVPSGTPANPPKTKGATRRQSIACQIAGSVCIWATIEQITTNGAASTGFTAFSQKGKSAGQNQYFNIIHRRIIASAHVKGCSIVQLTSDKQRLHTLRVYESLGFEATHEGFKLKL